MPGLIELVSSDNAVDLSFAEAFTKMSWEAGHFNDFWHVG